MFTIVKRLKSNQINFVKSILTPTFLNLPSERNLCSKPAEELDFFNVKLKCQTKVPQVPYKESVTVSRSRDIIDEETLLLLERLSLVNVEDKQALKTLEDSIEFANHILNINTDNIEPMYTVLEDSNLYLREDIAKSRNTQEDILSNASIFEEGYFVAPPGNIPLKQEDRRIDTLSKGNSD